MDESWMRYVVSYVDRKHQPDLVATVRVLMLCVPPCPSSIKYVCNNDDNALSPSVTPSTDATSVFAANLLASLTPAVGSTETTTIAPALSAMTKKEKVSRNKRQT